MTWEDCAQSWEPLFLPDECRFCGLGIKHTGATGGIQWFVAEYENPYEDDGGHPAWVCLHNPKPPGGYGQHEPTNPLAIAEIAQAIESIKGGQ